MQSTPDSGKQIAQDLADSFYKPLSKVRDAMTVPGEFLMRLLGIEPAQPPQPASTQGVVPLPPAWEKANQESIQQQLAPKSVLRMRRPNQ